MRLVRAYFEYTGVPLSEDEDEDVPAPLAEDEADYIDIMMVSCVIAFGCTALIVWNTGSVRELERHHSCAQDHR